MEKRREQAPFEICRESVLFPQRAFTPWQPVQPVLCKSKPDKKRYNILLAGAAVLILGFIALVWWQLPRANQLYALPSKTIQTRPTEEPSPDSKDQELMDLGMVLLDLTTDQTAITFHVPRQGVYVLAVSQEGAAYMAGIRSGDCILKVGETEVFDTTDFNSALNMQKSMQWVELTVLRGRERLVMNCLIPASGEKI